MITKEQLLSEIPTRMNREMEDVEPANDRRREMARLLRSFKYNENELHLFKMEIDRHYEEKERQREARRKTREKNGH